MMHTLPVLAEAKGDDLMGREFLFHSPEWLWVLIPLAFLLLLRRRRGTSACVNHPGLRMIATHLRKPHTLAGRLGPVLLVLAAASLVVALARPQWRDHHEEQKVSGIDIMIALDLSGSMASIDMEFLDKSRNGGRGIPQRVDRLTAAKQVTKEFIKSRPNDRIGLVAFAGKAKLCSPLTLDHGIILDILNDLYLAEDEEDRYIKEDGTAIGSAIASAATRLQARKETKSKIIILVTDGVNNRGKISPTEASRQAAELGIKIFTIGIGEQKQISRYVYQNVDPLDEKTLRGIAGMTHGQYYRASSGESLQQAFDMIDTLEKTDVKRRMFTSHVELFLYPLLVALGLLLAGFALSFIRPHPAP